MSGKWQGYLLAVLALCAVAAVFASLDGRSSAPRSIGLVSSMPSSEPADDFDVSITRVMDSVDLDRVAVILTPEVEAEQVMEASEWEAIQRTPCGRLAYSFVADPLSHTAETVARSCEFNPDDVRLTRQQMESLRELMACFRPALEDAVRLQESTALVEIESAFQERRGRAFGELPPCTEDQRRRAEELTEAEFARRVADLQKTGLKYDEARVRRGAREQFARTMDPDGGRRMYYRRFNGPDGLIILIDALPQTSQAYQAIFYHSHSLARSVVAWFRNRRILDDTRGLRLEERIDSAYEELRKYYGEK
jgi:hypothetical protein